MKYTPEMMAKLLWLYQYGTERSYVIDSEEDLDRYVSDVTKSASDSSLL